MKKIKLVHFEIGCRRAHENYRKFYRTITTRLHDEVTCQKCLNKINRLGLKQREDFPAIPTFEAKADKLGWYFTCPVCGRKLTHGHGPGHRVSHCDCWEDGYELVLAGQCSRSCIE